MSFHALPSIKGFSERSSIAWPGHISSVLYLPYCNLRCPFCYSHQLVLSPDSLQTLELDDILKRLSQIDQIEGICISGGEPTIHRDLPALLEVIRKAGFKAKIDTNGTQPDMLNYVIKKKLVDHVTMDVKAPLDDTSYSHCAGVFVPTDFIKESIRVLLSSNLQVSFRTTVAPAFLSEDNIYTLAKQVKSIAKELGEKHPLLFLQNLDPTDTLAPDFKDLAPYDEQRLSIIQRNVDNVMR